MLSSNYTVLWPGIHKRVCRNLGYIFSLLGTGARARSLWAHYQESLNNLTCQPVSLDYVRRKTLINIRAYCLATDVQMVI